MTNTLQNLKQQIQELDNSDNFEIKFLLGNDWGYIPASAILSDSLSSEYLSAIEKSEFQLIDLRSIDDDKQLTELISDAKFFKNDTDLNQIYRSLVLLPVRRYTQGILTDRSGIFLSNSDVTVPTDKHTDKTYDQILNEAALSYADKNPIVMWSGGVDSTAILAALVKNNVNFSVAFDSNSQVEAPEMYEYIKLNFDCLPLNNYTLGNSGMFEMVKEPVSNRTVVTGDCNDQIFPILQHHLALGKMFFKYHIENIQNININDINSFYKQPVDDSIKYMSSRDYFASNHSRIHQCDISESQTFYDNVLLPKLSQFPIDTQYAYQLISYFRFIFKYQMHLERLNDMNKRNTLNNTFKAFYNTDDFQRWSITNLENNYETYSSTYLTMKREVKQYSYDVFKIDEILQQHKRASGLVMSHLSLPDSMISN